MGGFPHAWGQWGRWYKEDPRGWAAVKCGKGGEGRGGMGPRIREETGGGRGNGGEEGVFMGGMVARRVEGMGQGQGDVAACARTRIGERREQREGSAGGGGIFHGGMVAGEGDFGQWKSWQWGEVFTPILAFPHEGGRKGIGEGRGAGGWVSVWEQGVVRGRDGSPHARGHGGGEGPGTTGGGREGEGWVSVCAQVAREGGWVPACARKRRRVGGFVFFCGGIEGWIWGRRGDGGFHGGMVAGEGDFGQGKVGTTGGLV